MKKFTKAEVKFESPGMGKQKCQDCTYYESDYESCRIVAGVIRPRDWCNQWKPRKKT